MAPRILSAAEAAGLILDNAVVTVSSSSGLGCPDAMLAAIGERFERSGHPRSLTTIHPIAAGDMYGVKGIDHIAKEGLLARVLAGSYPSGPSSMPSPAIWEMVTGDRIPAYNVPSGILFDMIREAAAKRPGVLTKIGLDTFVDPDRQGCAMNARAAAEPIVRKTEFAGDTWLFFPTIVPEVAIIRATTADERGNLSYEHEGAYLGPLDQALAVRNNGGLVIAQVKRLAEVGHAEALHGPRAGRAGRCASWSCPTRCRPRRPSTIPPSAARSSVPRAASAWRPGVWTRCWPAAWRRRCAKAGRSISASASRPTCPRILLEEGRHGDVTWVIEQGAVGGVPLLDFQFGCSANAEAIVPSPYQFTYFQGGGFDCSLLSFMQIDKDGSVNVSRLAARPHVTAGCGGFVDITARAKRIVFSGYFTAGAKLGVEDGHLQIAREGKVKKLVPEVEHVSFSGRRAVAQGQDITYVTERCVLRLTPDGLVVTELAPGVDLERDVLAQADLPLKVAPDLRTMDARLFRPEPIGLELPEAAGR